MECIKLYLKDAKTGEMAIKFVCRRCGKVMDERPEDWAVAVYIRSPVYG